MKYILLLFLISSTVYGNCQYKDRNIQLSIYTAGKIISVSELVPPYYKKLNYATIGFYPKIGYSIKGKYNFGVVCNYAFANSTLGNAESLSGAGYYLKYSFMPKDDTTKKFKRLIFFVEWLHVMSDGYYDYNASLAPLKIDKKVDFLSLHVGVDLRFKKGFCLGFSMGIGSTSLYKNSSLPEAGARKFIEPFGKLTFQYNFKL